MFLEVNDIQLTDFLRPLATSEEQGRMVRIAFVFLNSYHTI